MDKPSIMSTRLI